MEEKRTYETTYILSPDLSLDEYQAFIDKYNRYLADNKAEVINQELWGLKTLAYPIQKKTSGYYVYTEYLAGVALTHKLELEYSYNEKIMRYLTVECDKDHIAFNLRRRKKISEMPKETPKPKKEETVIIPDLVIPELLENKI